MCRFGLPRAFGAEGSNFKNRPMHESNSHEISISVETPLPFGECLVRLRRILSHAGFRVLAEVPFHREFEEHLGLKWPRYTVLVVWSPFHAYQSVLNDAEAGILLPFHIVVAEREKGTLVAATNLSLLGHMTGRIGLRLVGNDLTKQIQRILDQLRVRQAEQANLPAGHSKEST
jgi:uncharacterized protein (DUF302 family)